MEISGPRRKSGHSHARQTPFSQRPVAALAGFKTLRKEKAVGCAHAQGKPWPSSRVGKGQHPPTLRAARPHQSSARPLPTPRGVGTPGSPPPHLGGVPPPVPPTREQTRPTTAANRPFPHRDSRPLPHRGAAAPAPHPGTYRFCRGSHCCGLSAAAAGSPWLPPTGCRTGS